MKNFLLLPLLLLCVWSQAAWSTDPTRPLLMPGKQTLYQRVLAAPDSQLAQGPDAPQIGAPVTPFTALYVYDRRQGRSEEWLQVGSDRFGKVIGWLPESRTLDWPQGLTAVFRDPTGHDRSLLFRDRDALKALVEDNDLQRYGKLYSQASAGDLSEESPVVAIQPEGYVDIRENFYLVPIRAHEDVYLGDEQARMLRVSSVPLATQQPEQQPDQQPSADAQAEPESEPTAQAEPAAETDAEAAPPSDYSAGLVFVIDSTLSMDPYIDRTREAVMKIYDTLGDAGLLGSVYFGLVSFRDAPSAAPNIGYLTRTYVTLEQGENPATFLNNVNSLKAANASTKDFIEDSYAGVKEAIDSMQWEKYNARYIVLITDAGARGAGDPLSSTGMNAGTLSQLARDRGIAVFVLHLLTEATMPDHAADAAQYRDLSQFPGIGSLYYGVPTGNVEEFGHVLDTLAGQITMQVKVAATSSPLPTPTPTPDEEENPQLAELQAKVAKLGYALRMRYLQKDEEEKVPSVFDAWLLDRDLRNPERRTLDVRVLLTRDQLSDLHDILKQVLNKAEEGLLSPQNFLNELKSLAATISRDPEQLGATTAVTAGAGNSLADLGFMREYIEDLPYTGEVMNISLDDWESWPARDQIDFLHRLEEKISYYRALHDHTDLWVSLDKGPVDGDSVFALALEMLP